MINDLLGKTTNQNNAIHKMLKHDKQMTKNKDEISNILNDYFVNIGPNLSAIINNQSMSSIGNISCSVNSFFFLPIVPMEVYRESHNLNSKKAEGPEGIPVQFYKDANECILVFLCKLFNACVQIGFFPSALKLAKVIPVYKGDDHCSPNNYRPISLLSPISKIFEILISKRLNKFLEKQKILVDEQLGFRKLHSTTLAITDIFSQISNNIDCSRYTCVLLLDLRKAFDTVDHELLLYKLDRYGIRGNVLDLFQSYLIRRFQYVYVNDSTSNKLEVKCGVPQGSILGFTLFSLYVNDLPKICEFNVRLFADDTVLIMSDRDLQNLNKT